jgi:hypothetical protein
MIRRNCSWGVLVGGREFLVFYMDKRVEGNDIYHHLILSGRHDIFPQTATPATPGLIPVLIALLLGDNPVVQYKPPRTSVGTRCVKRTRSETASAQMDKGVGGKTVSSGRKAADSVARAGGRRNHRTGLETSLETLLDGIHVSNRALKPSSTFNP